MDDRMKEDLQARPKDRERLPGIGCPQCGHRRTVVTKTVPADGSTIRYRQCSLSVHV